VAVAHCDDTPKEAPPAFVNLARHRTASALPRWLTVPEPLHDPSIVAGAARAGASAALRTISDKIRTRMVDLPFVKTGLRIENAGGPLVIITRFAAPA
jgi:hypothetical protein